MYSLFYSIHILLITSSSIHVSHLYLCAWFWCHMLEIHLNKNLNCLHKDLFFILFSINHLWLDLFIWTKTKKKKLRLWFTALFIVYLLMWFYFNIYVVYPNNNGKITHLRYVFPTLSFMFMWQRCPI